MSIVKKTLGELCIIEKGKIGIQKAIPGEFPLVVTAEERLSHNEYHFEGNAVVIPLVSSTGHGHKSLKRIHFQTGKFAVGNILCAVMPKDESLLNAEYLYRFLDLNREKELVGRMKGMANVSLPLKEIALIEIPLPPVAEQLKFVEDYKQLETAKNKLDVELTHQLTLVKKLRQSFLREAMQGKLTADFRCAYPELIEGENSAQALLEKIKVEKKQLIKDGKLKKDKELSPVCEDEIPFDIPEGWVWCRINDVFEFSNGKAHEQYVNKNGDYILVNSKFVSNSGITELKHSIAQLSPLNENDLVIVMSDVPKGRALCRTYVIPSNNLYTLNQRIGCLKISIELNVYFFNYVINRNNYFLEFDNGKSQTNLRKEQIISCPIPLPSLSEQQAIVSKLDELMRTCDELEASISTSQQQNEMLLQQVLREALEV